MVRRNAIAAAVVVVLSPPVLPVLAQGVIPVPGVQSPVPLPPPPPVSNAQQLPGTPPKLDTFSDKVARCLHFGASQGLQAGERDAYSRACANSQ
jgi:hypothetical protein